MKTVSIVLSCALLAILLFSSSATASGYVNLQVNTEKWFTAPNTDDIHPQRMHTVVLSHSGGLFKMRREILQGDQVNLTEDRIFGRNSEGDIFYHGVLSEPLYDDPILWVDAPLAIGKTWKDSRALAPNPDDTDPVVHYVFAVLEKERISCPMGAFECYRVFLSEIYPDGRVENCDFWYNESCGLIRCCMYQSPVFSLRKIQVDDDGGDGGHDIHNPPVNDGLFGTITGSPNPANPLTSISFEMKAPGRVDVEVFDISGRLIKRLAQGEEFPAGKATLRWQGNDDQGRSVASGIYLVQVKSGESMSTKRITLVR